MICILRIGGFDLKAIEDLLPFAPYRKDIRGQSGLAFDVFYYDVAEATIATVLASKIQEFVHGNEAAFLRLNQHPNVEWRNLDIGLTIENEALTSTLELEADFIRLLGEVGLSLSISTYKTSEPGA